MKRLLLLIIFYSQSTFSQQKTCENIFIITTDGFRWQELFNGADSAILFNPRFVKDTSVMRYMYWSSDTEERRRRLMPFLWNYVAHKGQLWGNRQYNNTVSVANPYRFSYAGYNEILSGYADPFIIANKPKLNRNSNILHYLHSLPAYEGKVAAFGSWKLFSYIINSKQDGMPVNSGYQLMQDDTLSYTEQATNYVQETIGDETIATRADMLTYTLAAEYIQRNHPKVVYIGFGETDEFAHHSQYDEYLSKANQFDKFLAELWNLVQRDEVYKNKTTFFVTTDHGRGKKASTWMKHGPFTRGADETWLVQLGPNILPLGEIKAAIDIDNEQFAQTIAAYLGEVFVTNHPVAAPAYPLLSLAGE